MSRSPLCPVRMKWIRQKLGWKCMSEYQNLKNSIGQRAYANHLLDQGFLLRFPTHTRHSTLWQSCRACRDTVEHPRMETDAGIAMPSKNLARGGSISASLCVPCRFCNLSGYSHSDRGNCPATARFTICTNPDGATKPGTFAPEVR